MWDESGNREAGAFDLLNQALDWCAEYKLKAIVDLHILRSHHFNNQERPLWTQREAQELFYQCWRELSDALHTRPVDAVAYELMNEPVADDPDDWNRLVAKAVSIVRAKEPSRMIVIGSNRWQSADTFDKLKVPQDDPNILLSFHFYEPFLLTHHTASWTSIGGYRGPVKYPFIGRWRIIEMEQWDQDFVDLVSPGHITLARGGRGELHFGAVEVTLDWRARGTGNQVDFSFRGFDEGDEVSGRGWAELDGDKLTGRIGFHQGDESEYAARRAGKAKRRKG